MERAAYQIWKRCICHVGGAADETAPMARASGKPRDTSRERVSLDISAKCRQWGSSATKAPASKGPLLSHTQPGSLRTSLQQKGRSVKRRKHQGWLLALAGCGLSTCSHPVRSGRDRNLNRVGVFVTIRAGATELLKSGGLHTSSKTNEKSGPM